MKNEFNLIYGSFNALEGLPSQPIPFIDLGNRNPDYIKKALGIEGLRKDLFPQVSATFRYWQFAVWCERHSKLNGREIADIRSKFDGLRIGPKSAYGLKAGALWLRGIRELAKTDLTYSNLLKFIETKSKEIHSLSPTRGFDKCISMTQSKSLDEQWQRLIKQTFTPAGREFYKHYKSNRHLSIDQILQHIASGKIASRNQQLAKAAVIYGALRALYGYQELEDDESRFTEKSQPARGFEKISQERIWAKALLQGIKRNPIFPEAVKQFHTNIQVTLENPKGAAWNDVWRKTNGQKKLLLGFKFSRVITIVEKSLYAGST